MARKPQGKPLDKSPSIPGLEFAPAIRRVAVRVGQSRRKLVGYAAPMYDTIRRFDSTSARRTRSQVRRILHALAAPRV
jgi:hypothetical protein